MAELVRETVARDPCCADPTDDRANAGVRSAGDPFTNCSFPAIHPPPFFRGIPTANWLLRHVSPRPVVDRYRRKPYRRVPAGFGPRVPVGEESAVGRAGRRTGLPLRFFLAIAESRGPTDPV